MQCIKKAIAEKQAAKQYLTTLEFYGQEMVREIEQAMALKREIQQIKQDLQTFD